MTTIFITLMIAAVAISATALIILARFLRRQRKNEEALTSFKEMSQKLHKTIARHQELRERLVGVDEFAGPGSKSQSGSVAPRRLSPEQLN